MALRSPNKILTSEGIHMHTERTLLLAITGMSPAVVTETLYGIDCNGGAWPKEIKIITTSKGKAKIAKGLIEDQQLEKLCQELGKPMIPFSDEQIMVVPNAEGKPVEDARNLADHEALANFIMTTVRNEAQNNNTRIHASIAGGRKTMTFYLGYAMSLFGRHFDKLSHVLVGENSEMFERCPDFYFPTRNDHIVREFNGAEHNAKNATVILADIPFIRQRALVPELMKNMQDNIDFRLLTHLINLGEQPDQVELHAYPAEQYLMVKSRNSCEEMARVHFPNLLHWSTYLLLLEDTLRDPEEREEFCTWDTKARDDIFAMVLLKKVCEIRSMEPKGDTIEEISTNLAEDFDREGEHAGLKSSLDSIAKTGFTGGNFNTYRNAIKKTLSDKLPTNLANLLVPKQQDQTLSDEELAERNAESNSNPKPKGERSSRRKTKTGIKGGQYYIIKLPNQNKQIFINN
jgi:CRISPR-associated protein (TIGR02584 family)